MLQIRVVSGGALAHGPFSERRCLSVYIICSRTNVIRPITDFVMNSRNLRNWPLGAVIRVRSDSSPPSRYGSPRVENRHGAHAPKGRKQK